MKFLAFFMFFASLSACTTTNTTIIDASSTKIEYRSDFPLRYPLRNPDNPYTRK